MNADTTFEELLVCCMNKASHLKEICGSLSNCSSLVPRPHLCVYNIASMLGLVLGRGLGLYNCSCILWLE